MAPTPEGPAPLAGLKPAGSCNAPAGGRLSAGWRGGPAHRLRPFGARGTAGTACQGPGQRRQPPRLARRILAAGGDAPVAPVSPPHLPPPDPSPLTSPHAPPLTLARGPGPSSLASAMLRPPPSAVPARGEGPGVTPSQPFPPPPLRGAPGRGSAGCRGRPRAVLRQEGAGAGGEGGGPGGSLRAAGGGRTRQAASPLKAATTSPARGPSAHAPRACARRRVPASRLPPPSSPRRRSVSVLGGGAPPQGQAGWLPQSARARGGARGAAQHRHPWAVLGAGGARFALGGSRSWRASTGPMVATGPVTSWRGHRVWFVVGGWRR